MSNSILIVEDEVKLASLLADYFQLTEYSPHLIHHGDEVIAWVKNNQPKAILLDEPFSKLDTQLRVDTRELVFSQIRDHKLPAIMVTHDHSDAEAANGTLITLSSAL